MTVVMGALLQTLAAGGERADGLASAICTLIVEGGKLGELEPYQVRDPTHPDGVKTCRRPPAAWFARLLSAVELGAFERQTPKQIAERILSTPDPVEAKI